MIKKYKFTVKKAVFQINYKANVSFYDQMYNLSKLFAYPHWETDRLRLTLRDYDKKQSVVIKHNSIGYETDNYKPSNLKEFSSLASNYLAKSNSKEKITRLGYRTWSLCEVGMQFEELNDILNLKLLNSEFLKFDNNEPSDLSLTIIGCQGDLTYRLFIGPMKNIEVPNFINYNIKNHIDPNSIKRYDEIAAIQSSYPKVSFYMDLDIYKNFKAVNKLLDTEVESFHQNSQNVLKETSQNLLTHVFESKL